MIDLTTCVKGQKLLLRDGRIATYMGLTQNYCYPHKTVLLEGEDSLYTYQDNGSYHSKNKSHTLDVIEILPLKTTKTASHPSIAWWESCPWITDRKPTKEDADEFGRVLVIAEPTKILSAFFQDVRIKEAWIHHGNWQPPALTNREQALQLLDDHQAGWMPTPGQWHIIRKGLEAS